MSESMNMPRRNIRWELMATGSVLALCAAVYNAGQARAADNDADRPTLWIELGAQSEQVNGFGDPFAPPFTHEIVADGFTSPLQLQSALAQSVGGEGTISFQPENSDWVFSASVRYGRANGRKSVHEQTPGGYRHLTIVTPGGFQGSGSLPLGATKFSETRVTNNETHAILDFQAGKDLGLGLFGGRGQSTVSFGLRFAQFTSKQVLGINADPDFYFPKPLTVDHDKYHHTYAVTSHMERSFRGLGPSLSWNASAPVIGEVEQGGLFVDWGANAAFLFGRQKISGHHQTVAGFYKSNALRSNYRFASHFQRSGTPVRSHTVVVPNAGGFAGLSYRFSNAKLSLGYRGDFFFGAIDGGVDVARKETRGFYGPFASVSVGLGG
jgi:iron complex outermembrane recepter protein